MENEFRRDCILLSLVVVEPPPDAKAFSGYLRHPLHLIYANRQQQQQHHHPIDSKNANKALGLQEDE